jgi:oxygen-dependent protoporphyrinogen oxidase
MAGKRVIIIGAGISGLSLAWFLRARGLNPTVLEKEADAGGKLATDAERGFLCERGAQSFFFQEPAVANLVRELGLADRVVPATGAGHTRCVVAGGKLVPVPASPMALLRSRLLPPLARLRALADLVLPRGPAARGEEESVASFARRRFGHLATERLFFPLVSGLYASDPERTSLPSAFPLFAGLERRERSLISALAKGRAESAVARPIATFRTGMHELPSAIGSRLAGELHLHSAVEHIRAHDSRYRLSVFDRGERSELDGDAVALAIPAHAAAQVLSALDPALSEAVGSIAYLPLAVVYLGYLSEPLRMLPKAYGFLVAPSERTRMLGAVFTSVIFPGHAPAGFTLVAARLGGYRDPEVLSLTDRELGRIATAELKPLLGATEAPVFTRIVRHARALPQYALGHSQRVDRIETLARRHPGLFLTGNAFRGLGITDCIRSSRLLARPMVAASQ